MKRIIPALVFVSLVGVVSGPVSGQSGPALKFDIADVHPSARSSNPNAQMRSTLYPGGRYEIRYATMVDLIGLAYSAEADKILSGPAWLEMNRFDVIATAPSTATRENLQAMLQALLADRFALKLHKDKKELAAFALTAGKQPKLKEADGSGQTGCEFQVQNMNNKDAGPPTFSYKCGNTTIAALVDNLPKMMVANQYLNNTPVIDETGLKGTWNFEFHFTFYSGPVGGGANLLFDAIDKQLGLKMEARRVPFPVVIVDSVNPTPTPNLPEITEKRLGMPTEFEVAEIKPSDPNAGPQTRNPFMPGGRVELRGLPLKVIIAIAWDTSPDKIVEGPKFIDSDKYDILAKAPAATSISSSSVNQNSQPAVDIDALRLMLRALLTDRFKLKVHSEDRPGDVYTLVAAKPKLKPADPSTRTGCKDGPGPDGKDPRKTNPILNRLVSCRNITLTQFGDALPKISPLYFRGGTTVANATGIEGAFAFTLSFSGVQIPQGGGRGGDSGRATAAGAAGQAVDPGGVLTLFDAMEKEIGIKLEMQKRPVASVVVDHIEPKPTDN